MSQVIKIGTRPVGEGHPCFVIAEIGSNHNMDLSMAKELIQTAAQVGADAVKFQSQKLEEQYLPERETEDFIKFFKQTEFPEEWYPELASEAKKYGVIFFSSPTYLHSIDLLEEVNVPLYKIASPQVATYPILVERVAQIGKPIILSAGMVTREKLTEIVHLCQNAGNNQLIILHCVSHYPTSPEEANLRTMLTYRSMFGCPVGFSDHTKGFHVALAAVTLGCSVLEKHITLDRNLPGPDHAFSIEPDEFKNMTQLIREVEASLGNGTESDIPSKLKEFIQRIDMKLVAVKEIESGTPLTPNLFIHRRTVEGISVAELNRLQNSVAAKTIPPRTPLYWHQVKPKNKESS